MRGRRFTKRRPDAPPGFFEAEARGLAWLAEAGAPVPEVLSVGPDHISLSWIEQGPWTPAAHASAGQAVARLHDAGAPCFGMPGDEPAYIGDLPMDNTPSPDWPAFWAERRVRPLVRSLCDRGDLGTAEAAAFDRLCDRLASLAGPPEPPARLHGDLWSGNVLCDVEGRPWLIDPAAHGGHRETDLAMLALFGGRTDAFLAAYEDEHPLADGWRDRVTIHQLHPLLVHALLFGGAYGARAVEIARRF